MTAASDSEDPAVSILETAASDGRAYTTRFHNLDAIIAVGYRVNSGDDGNSELSAEREGFEPSVPLQVHMISNHAPSATRSPLLG
jgi:hypothetical protein